MDKPKILIIDDDVDLCESITDIVELDAYSTDCAHTAADGLEKVESSFCNIVLLDMKLPDSDGLTVLGNIKQESPDTEVIIFTAYAQMDTVISAMDKEAFSFLPKPFEMTYLLTTIKRALKKQQLIHENRILYQQTIKEEREWEETFDSISDLVSIHDKDLNIIRCNKAVREKLNVDYSAIIGKKCHEVFHYRNEPWPTCPFLRCKESLKPEAEEEECMDGTFMMSCFPRLDTAGRFNGVVHIARDITERKNIEINLEQKKHDLVERYKELKGLYSLAALINQIDISSEDVFKRAVNLIPPAWQYPDITCGRITIEGKEFITDNYKETKWIQSADIIVEGNKIGIVEVCYLQEKPIIHEGPFLKEERDFINGFAQHLGLFVMRKHSDEVLKESENKFRTLVDNIPGASYRCANDENWTMEYISNEIENISGYPSSDFINSKFRTFDSIIHPDDLCLVKETINNSLKYKKPFELEYRLIASNKSSRWVLDKGQGLFNERGEILWLDGTIIDISGRKQAEAAMNTLVVTASKNQGKKFFEQVVSSLYDWLGVNCVILGQLIDEGSETALAMKKDDEFVNEFSYELRGSPCGDVLKNGFCHYPERVIDLFPEDEALVQWNAEGYVGISLEGKSGKCIGTLCALSQHRLELPPGTQNVFKIIAARAAVEIERMQAERTLQQQVRQLTGLNLLSKEIGSSLSLDNVVQAAIDGVIDVIKPDLALFFLKEGDKLILKNFGPKNGKYKHDETPVHKVGECLCGLTVSEKKSMYSYDILKDTRCTWEECKKAGLLSFATVPLFIGDEIIGVLGIGSGTKRVYEEQDAFLQIVANEIASGLQNSLLHLQLQSHANELEEEITDRKHAESSLEESEQKIRAIFDNTFQFIGLLNPDGTLVESNKGSLEFAGIKQSDVINKPFWKTPWWSHSVPLQGLLQKSIKQASQGNFVRFEATHIKQDGSLAFIDTSLTPVKDEDGNVIYIIPEGRDITELKLVEETVHKLSQAIQQSNVIVVITDLEGNIEYVNPRFCESTGYEYDEVIGQNPRILNSGETSEEEYRELWKTITSGNEWRGEFRNKKKSGELYWENASISPIRDLEGNIINFLGIKEDITDKKRSEQDLLKSEERHRSLIEATTSIIWTADESGGFVVPQLSWEKYTGQPWIEHKDYGWAKKIHPDDVERVLEEWKNAIREISLYETYGRIWNANLEEWRNFEVRAVPIRSKEHHNLVQEWVGVITDITARKQAEQALVESEKKLITSYKMASLGRLTAGVFHELLNPVNIISSHIQLLLMDTKSGSKTEEDLKSIQEEIKRIVKISDSLLRFSRKGEVGTDNVDLNDLIERTIAIVEPDMKLQKVKFKRILDDKLSTVIANSDQLRQVFLNLITNARDAMPEGGIITITSENVNVGEVPFVRLKIADTGCGIEKCKMHMVFDPFFTTKKEGKGTGLGLSTSFGIIEDHGGVMSAESEVGKGTTFIIDLPIKVNHH